ncbi:hypothetical protein ACMYS6_02955 [Streptococcus agalactiae]|jgi:hypothetical protein|uniref:Uncharacterized protein n=1 Tax=Streptococcus pyogenes TaxID=1314 RepID=Q6SZ20_STRPY|nr:unknown [Streptococcus pyogenes]QBX14865.1 hypothetical protein Javan159_0015 [Streptococcus phage Javan159]
MFVNCAVRPSQLMVALEENFVAEPAQEHHGGHDDERKYDMVNINS